MFYEPIVSMAPEFLYALAAGLPCLSFSFRTERLDQWQVSKDELRGALVQFRFWYNHVRPHQNLDGRTPAEVWRGIDIFTKGYKQQYWFKEWDGLLTGFYLEI